MESFIYSGYVGKNPIEFNGTANDIAPCKANLRIWRLLNQSGKIQF